MTSANCSLTSPCMLWDICALPQQRRPNTCKNVIKMTREIHVAKLMYKLCLHNHGYFVHEPSSKNRSGKVRRGWLLSREQVIFPTYYDDFPLCEWSLVTVHIGHSLGGKVIEGLFPSRSISLIFQSYIFETLISARQIIWSP